MTRADRRGLRPIMMAEFGTEAAPVGLPKDADEATAELVLPPHPTSPRSARQFVAEQLAAAGLLDISDTAALLTSEVVTNAVVHACTDLRLRVRSRGPWLMVEVADDNEDLPQLRLVPEMAVSGRGLALIAALADQWGVEPMALSKKVWFTLTSQEHSARLQPVATV